MSRHHAPLDIAVIGTGIAGFPIERCAQVMLEEVHAHLEGPTTLERVDFVLYDRRSLEVFERVLNS